MKKQKLAQEGDVLIIINNPEEPFIHGFENGSLAVCIRPARNLIWALCEGAGFYGTIMTQQIPETHYINLGQI